MLVEMFYDVNGRRRQVGFVEIQRQGRAWAQVRTTHTNRRLTDLLVQRLLYDAALEGIQETSRPLSSLAEVLRQWFVALDTATLDAKQDKAAATRVLLASLRKARERTETQLIRELGAPSDAEGQAWVPKGDLVSEREQIANWGGRRALTSAQAMEFVGLTTRQGLSRRRHLRKLFGLPLGERRYVYPQWQFTQGGALVPGLSEILQAAPAYDPWGVADLLTSSQPSLGGREPIEVLREGDTSTLPKVLSILDRVYG